ncbi:hypothetical protein BDF19DRAFT_435696 [Syncephalis fuscata]|nr:hypothetical protein BDF19DRAFT_435696 [Syncephalis fuscata]
MNASVFCPSGQKCFVQEDGFFCKPNNTAGCTISQLQIVSINIPQVGTGHKCKRCPVPKTLELRQQYQANLTSIVQDEGWHTYGNCKSGFCGLNGVCKPIKDAYSLCLTSSQCHAECIISSSHNNQFACSSGDMNSFFLAHLIIGLPAIIAGAILFIKKLVYYTSACSCIGLVAFIFGLCYTFLPPSAFPHDDDN